MCAVKIKIWRHKESEHYSKSKFRPTIACLGRKISFKIVFYHFLVIFFVEIKLTFAAS